jgi:hypothetical protein
VKCITLKVGGLAVVGGLELELVGVRDGQAALRSDGGVVLLGWPGDSLTVGETTIKLTRVQPSRVTVCVESPEVVRRV